MREITAEMADKRVTEAAKQLVNDIQAFNQTHPGPEPVCSPQTLFSTLTSIFALLLADRYVIVPPKE